nr:hypothetical protein [Lentzea atacamensis]
MRSAEDFDHWYADRVESPVADELVRRMLALPPDLQSTSLLSRPGLDEVVAILDPRPARSCWISRAAAAATAWRSSGAPAAGSWAWTSPPSRSTRPGSALWSWRSHRVRGR